MANFNWSRFTIRIPVKAAKKDLYKAWATKEGMEQWFLRLCEYKTAEAVVRSKYDYVKDGDTYRWLWHGWPDETVEIGTITDCNDIDYLKFSFGKAGNCSVRIKTEEGENIVELLQENIPMDESGMSMYHIGCKTGWTFYLANLKSVLEGGLDLRNKNEKVREVVNS